MPFGSGTFHHDLDPHVDQTVVDLARELYGSNVKVFHAHATYFQTAFPDQELYAVAELERHPVTWHAMVFNRTLEKAFDATNDFNLVLGLKDIIIDSSTKALTYGKAYVDVANIELLPHRHIMFSTDSDTLGYTITDPSAQPMGSDWAAYMTTWSDENGIISNWTVVFGLTSVNEATWRVTAMRVGDHQPEWEALNLREGVRVVNSYPVTGHDLAAYLDTSTGTQELLLPDDVLQLSYMPVDTKQNYDTSTWQTSYSGTPDASLTDWSTNLLNASVDAYARFVSTAACSTTTNPNQNWRLHARDPDCVLDIRIVPAHALFCGACVAAGNDTVLFVGADSFSYLHEDVQWYVNASRYNETAVAGLFVDHLLLTHFATPDIQGLPDVVPSAPNATYTRDDRTIDPEHPFLRHLLDPAYEVLSTQYERNNTIPIQEGCVIKVSADVGESVDREDLPSGWKCEISAVNYTTPILIFPEDTEFEKTPLGETIARKVGPGSKLVTEVEYPHGLEDLGCSGGFLMKEANASRFYMAVAGHCFLPIDDLDPAFWNDTVHYSTVEKEGSTYYPPGSEVSACTEDCTRGEGGDLLAGEECTTKEVSFGFIVCFTIWTKANYTRLGVVHYANYDGIGEDFGLVLIDQEWIDKGFLRAEVPMWGGPTGSACENNLNERFPQLAFLYGNGVVLGEHRVIKGRAGFFAGECWSRDNPENKTLGYLFAGKGDSGAAIVQGKMEGGGLSGGSGLAVVSGLDHNGTHPFVAGTSLDYGIDLVKRDLGFDLVLVCQMDPVVTC